MERLTKRDIKGRVVPKDSFGWRAMEKLAEYEDAEEEGRLVVLPCKVGDEVYLNLDGQTHKMRVQGISVAAYSTNCIIHFGGYPVTNLWGDEFGKTAFLTKEEAEAALEKMKGE